MKDNIAFFTHFTDAFENPKNQALIAEYGFEGYGRFWALNEFIGKSSKCMLDISKKRNKATIANKLQMSIQEFDEFIVFLADDEECGLLKITEDGYVWNEQTQEDLDRAMYAREKAASFRTGTNGERTSTKTTGSNRTSTNEKSTSTNEERTSTKSTDSIAQHSIGQDRTTQQQTAHEELVDNSEPQEPPGEHAEVFPKEVQAAAAVLNLQLREEDAKRAAANLTEYGLDAAFVAWAAEELKRKRNIKSPPGFLKKMLLTLGDYGDWIEQYRGKAEQEVPARASPPGECPHCGGATREIAGETWCNSCKRLLWEYDEQFDVWIEPKDSKEAAGW